MSACENSSRQCGKRGRNIAEAEDLDMPDFQLAASMGVGELTACIALFPRVARSESSKGSFVKNNDFVCGRDGWPNRCSTCQNWKLDRAHRCGKHGVYVLKMDRFCPWVESADLPVHNVSQSQSSS